MLPLKTKYIYSVLRVESILSDRTNFRRIPTMKEIYCVKSCQTELDNEHLVYCQELNSNPEIIFFKILNGTMPQKLEALHQTKENEKNRNMKRNTPVIR